ncbi:rab gdp/gtp exchange factor [Anaeramoeba flamelloides]|uniref:Rab gdp/gtp exchange factor n=1 Tax=Anaeramoeba flamelloides TaxID=1746091 RepID=A0ABQ8XYS4_9EUKA|nr:rab gdp/gtp exchange factor [Anaeramoeba flamelloides]
MEQKLKKKNDIHEILQLQMFLKEQSTRFSAENFGIATIKSTIDTLTRTYKSKLVSNFRLNKWIDTLNIFNVEKTLNKLIQESTNKSQNIINNLFQVQFYQKFGCPLSTYEKNNYRRLILLIRKHKKVIPDALISLSNNLTKKELDLLAQSSLFCVFSNLCNQQEEFKFLYFLSDFIELEFKKPNLSSDELLLNNKIMGKIISSYCKSTSYHKFFIQSLREVIIDVIQDHKLRIFNNKTEENKEKYLENMEKIFIICNKFLNSLQKKTTLIPFGIRWIMKNLKIFCKKYQREKDTNIILRNFFLVKFLNIVISSPERYDVVSDIPILEHHKMNLIEIVTTITNLCDPNEKILKFSTKKLEREKQKLNNKITTFFKLIANVRIKLNVSKNNQNTKYVDNNDLNMNSTLVSINDLYCLHSFFYQYAKNIVSINPKHKFINNQLIKTILTLGKNPSYEPQKKNKYLVFSLKLFFPGKRQKKFEKNDDRNSNKNKNRNNYQLYEKKPMTKKEKRHSIYGVGLSLPRYENENKNNTHPNKTIKHNKNNIQNKNNERDNSDKSNKNGIKNRNKNGNNALVKKKPIKKRHSLILLTKQKPKLNLKVNHKNDQKEIEKNIDDCIEKIKITLCEIRELRIERFDKEDNLLDILLREKQNPKTTYNLKTACIIDSSIISLEKLPKEIKKANYSEILERLYIDYEKRKKVLNKLINEKYRLQGISKQLQLLVSNTDLRQKRFLNFLKILISQRLINMNQSLLELKKKEIINSNSTQDQKKILLNFFEQLKEIIIEDPICNLFPDPEVIIFRIVHNHILTELHPFIFRPKFKKDKLIKLDNDFSEKMIKLQKILTPEFLGIPETIWQKDLWELAIVEFQRLNKYYSPMLKIEVLAKCAKIVNMILLYNKLKAVGADLMVPLIIYITMTVNLKHLPSNVKYIDQFINSEIIDPENEYWFTVFKSAYIYLCQFKVNDIPKSKN